MLLPASLEKSAANLERRSRMERMTHLLCWQQRRSIGTTGISPALVVEKRAITGLSAHGGWSRDSTVQTNMDVLGLCQFIIIHNNYTIFKQHLNSAIYNIQFTSCFNLH